MRVTHELPVEVAVVYYLFVIGDNALMQKCLKKLAQFCQLQLAQPAIPDPGTTQILKTF